MQWDLLINPIVGGIIGYATNYLAIKMLFKPHTPKYIGKMKIPFTPGLIPKEKAKLARQMGQITEEYLLTEDMLVDTLTDPKAKEIFFNLANGVFKQIEASDQSINEAVLGISTSNMAISREIMIDRFTLELINLLRSKEVMDLAIPHIIDSLEKVIKQQLTDGLDSLSIQAYVEELGQDILDNEKTKSYIKTTLDTIEEKMYLMLEDNASDIGKSIILAIGEGEEANKIKETMEHWIEENFNPMVSMFIKVDKIYEGLIHFAKEALDDPVRSEKFGQLLCTLAKGLKDSSGDYQGEITSMIKNEINQTNVGRLIEILLEELGQKEEMVKKQIKEWVYSQWSDYTGTIAFTHIVKNILKQVMDLIGDIPLKNISIMIPNESKKQISESIFKYYRKVIVKNSDHVAQLMDVSALVENEINKFTSQEAETVILSVVKEQLRGITWIGALLGTLIGIISNLLG